MAALSLLVIIVVVKVAFEIMAERKLEQYHFHMLIEGFPMRQPIRRLRRQSAHNFIHINVFKGDAPRLPSPGAVFTRKGLLLSRKSALGANHSRISDLLSHYQQ